MHRNKRVWGGFLVLLAFAGATTSAQSLEEFDDQASHTAESQPEPDLSAVAKRIIRRTNEFRTAHGRQAVVANRELMKTAADFAEYMATNDEYGHRADGRRPSERASQHGYKYCLVAENIAYRHSSRGFGAKQLGRRFVTGWQNSPEHRQNMLDRDVLETGVAVARSASSGTYYAVQMFGRPESERIEFEVTNPGSESVTYTVKGKTTEREFSLPPGATRMHQRCRPVKLTFSQDGEQQTISIENGGRYSIASGSNRHSSGASLRRSDGVHQSFVGVAGLEGRPSLALGKCGGEATHAALRSDALTLRYHDPAKRVA
ncbi:MAG: CAP domain-containing protein [Pirellulaceae bacterium]